MDRNKCCMIHLYVESKKKPELMETESRMMIKRGGGRGRWGVLATGYKVPGTRGSGALLYSMVTTVNNTALYPHRWLKGQVVSILTTHTR